MIAASRPTASPGSTRANGLGRLLLVGGLLVATACTSNDQLWMDFPDTNGAQSMLLAVTRNGEVEIHAIAITATVSSFRVVVGIDELGEGTIEALLFDASIVDLGLPEGRLERAVPASAGEDLPSDYVRAYRGRIDAAQRVAEWELVDGPSASVRDFPWRRDRPECARFGVLNRAWDFDGEYSYGFTIDDDHAVMGTNLDEHFLLARDGPSLLSFPNYFTAAFRDEGSTVWLGDLWGDVYRGTVSSTVGVTNLQQVSRFDYPYTLRSLDGGRTGSGDLEIFALSSRDHVGHYVNGTWTDLGAASETEQKIIWTGPGEALVLNSQPGLITAVRNGRLEPIPLLDQLHLMSMARTDALGVVLGSADGQLYKYSAQGIQLIPDAAYGWWVSAILGFDRGFLFLLASGSLGQYQEGTGYCTDVSVQPIIKRGMLLPFGRDVLVITRESRQPKTHGILVPRL